MSEFESGSCPKVVGLLVTKVNSESSYCPESVGLVVTEAVRVGLIVTEDVSFFDGRTFFFLYPDRKVHVPCLALPCIVHGCDSLARPLYDLVAVRDEPMYPYIHVTHIPIPMYPYTHAPIGYTHVPIYIPCTHPYTHTHTMIHHQSWGRELGLSSCSFLCSRSSSTIARAEEVSSRS